MKSSPVPSPTITIHWSYQASELTSNMCRRVVTVIFGCRHVFKVEGMFLLCGEANRGGRGRCPRAEPVKMRKRKHLCGRCDAKRRAKEGNKEAADSDTESRASVVAEGNEAGQDFPHYGGEGWEQMGAWADFDAGEGWEQMGAWPEVAQAGREGPFPWMVFE